MSKNFEALSVQEQQLVRIGYHKLNKKYLDDNVARHLTMSELSLYRGHGEAWERRERWKKRAGYGLALLFILIMGLYAVRTMSSMRASIAAVESVDICPLIISRTEQYLYEIGAQSYAPSNPVTKHDKNNIKTSCVLLIKGGKDNYYYTAGVSAQVEKSIQQQSDNTKEKGAEIISDQKDPYNVYGWTAHKGHYKISVQVGINPKDTNQDKEYSDALARLIAITVGIGIADDLPDNTQN